MSTTAWPSLDFPGLSAGQAGEIQTFTTMLSSASSTSSVQGVITTAPQAAAETAPSVLTSSTSASFPASATGSAWTTQLLDGEIIQDPQVPSSQAGSTLSTSVTSCPVSKAVSPRPGQPTWAAHLRYGDAVIFAGSADNSTRASLPTAGHGFNQTRNDSHCLPSGHEHSGTQVRYQGSGHSDTVKADPQTPDHRLPLSRAERLRRKLRHRTLGHRGTSASRGAESVPGYHGELGAEEAARDTADSGAVSRSSTSSLVVFVAVLVMPLAVAWAGGFVVQDLWVADA